MYRIIKLFSHTGHSSLPSSLPDPKFIAAHLIPDNADRDNDKVYFFFTEKAVEAGDREGAIHTHVGRVCAVRFVRRTAALRLRIQSTISFSIKAELQLRGGESSAAGPEPCK